MSHLHSAADALLADLNDEQRRAATHGAGPLLIVAGAGTGKTATLARRVAWLIAGGVDPARVLLLTFTRRAAAEMLRRVDGLLDRLSNGEGGTGRRGVRAGSRLWGGTFHSVATRLLRQHGRLIGLEPDFTILDRSDSEDLLNLLRSDLKLASGRSRFPLKGTCADIYSRLVNTQGRLDEILARDFPWCVQEAAALARLFEAYVDRKESQAVLDYDDLLVFWHALVSDPAAAGVVREWFDGVLVDEYQDTNTLQAEILKSLRPDGTGLTVVGDDAQSIYSFRAATVRNILDFPDVFPGTTIVTLEQNYRSTQPLLDVSNSVIRQAAEWHPKQLWSARAGGERPELVDCLDEDEQTQFVCDAILDRRESGVLLREQAVLYRASHHSLGLEIELARRNIPFHKYGGLKFVETAHVKDLLAFLRLAENPRDQVAGLRVLMLLPGLGPKRARQLLGSLGEARWRFASWREAGVLASTREFWPGLVDLLATLSSPTRGPESVAGQVHCVLAFYAPLLERRYDHAASRLRDLEQLEALSVRFGERSTFLAELTLDPPTSTQELPADPLLDDDYLVLSTIHSAKGLEWESVYVIHAADGNIPSDMATRSPEEIEEERRLFYVALTRAKNRLVVCWPQRYYFAGRRRSDFHSFAQLTRFVPDETRTLFDERPGQVLQEIPPPHMPLEARTSDVRRAVKGLWTP